MTETLHIQLLGEFHMQQHDAAFSFSPLEQALLAYLLLHRDTPAVPVSRIVDRLNREVEAGRARALGASNWSTMRVDEANAYAAAKENGMTVYQPNAEELAAWKAVSQPVYDAFVAKTGDAGKAMLEAAQSF